MPRIRQIKIDAKTLRILVLAFAVPIVVFIAAKLITLSFLSSDDSASRPKAAVAAAPPAPVETPPVAADSNWVNLDPSHRSYKVTVDEDNSLKLNSRPAKLYGLQIIPRSKICTYASGERWACGQRAYVAVLNAMGSTTVDCRERSSGAPVSIDTPRSYVCRLPGTDIAELLLKRGWGTVEDGVIDPVYVAAAASARSMNAGMWRSTPSAGP